MDRLDYFIELYCELPRGGPGDDASTRRAFGLMADLPRKLDTTSAPASYTPEAGDITHYAPWGNLAIFYKRFRTSKGLVRLGAFDGPIDALLKDGAISVRIEAAE